MGLLSSLLRLIFDFFRFDFPNKLDILERGEERRGEALFVISTFCFVFIWKTKCVVRLYSILLCFCSVVVAVVVVCVCC